MSSANSNAKAKLIAQGTYGCVYGPPIKCINPSGTKINIDYDKYVSKLGDRDTVIEEIEEIKKMNKVDPYNKYHTGEAFRCTPDFSTVSKTELKKCNQTINVQTRLLMMKYGGISLNGLIQDNGKLLRDYVLNNTIKVGTITYPVINLSPSKKVEIFWNSTIKLFKGLVEMRKKNIIHRDLKPGNILFNPSTSKFNYIDFGLMGSTDTIRNLGDNDKDYLGIFFWSLPLENSLLNKTEYNERYSSRDWGNKKKILSDRSHKYFANHLFLPNEPNGGMITNYKEMVKDYFKYMQEIHFYGMSPTETKNQIIQDGDIFGLGFSLKMILNVFYTNKFISEIFYTDCRSVLEHMYTYNPGKRIHDPTILLKMYEGMIHDQLNNNTLVNISLQTSPQVTRTRRITVPKSPSKCTTRGKILNPLSNRCVKQCPSNYTRNNKFRCVRRGYGDSEKRNKMEKCVDTNKDYNVKTHRCVKKCGPRHTRNSNFKCVFDKTLKIKKLTKIDKCISINKDYNKRTDRCVKKCGPRHTRNAKFKCVSKKHKGKYQTKLNKYYPVALVQIRKPPSPPIAPPLTQTLMDKFFK